MLEVAFRLDKNTTEGLYERDETPTTRIFFLEADSVHTAHSFNNV